MPAKASSRSGVAGVTSDGARSGRTERVLVSVGTVLLTVGLVAASYLGLTFTLIACGAAAYVFLIALLGAERTAILTLMGAFATAPMYKGLAPTPGSQVTATDVLLVVGFVLLVPLLVGRRVHLPTVYFVGLIIVVITGLVASALSTQPAVSFFELVLWLMVMGGLPPAFALWRPSGRVIELLAWSYVAGQVFNMGYALVDGPWVQDRYAGLSQHPNYFGQAGMMALALLLYLFHRYRSAVGRVAVLGAAGVCGASVIVSGSRAALVVVAVLVMMSPFVDRAAVRGFVYALGGGLVIVAFPLIVGIAGEQSAIGRLQGGAGSALSDAERTEGLRAGWDRFLERPLTGNGLIDLFTIHNNFLEVMVAIGVFGLVGYVMVLFAFARPLFGLGEHRRLCYTVWAYMGFGATIPSLTDRSIWLPVALSVIAIVSGSTRTLEHRPSVESDVPATPDEVVASSRGHR